MTTQTRTDFRTMIEKEFLGTWDFPRGPDGKHREATVEIASVDRYKPPRIRQVRGPDGKLGPERNKRIVIGFVGKRKKWLAGPVSQAAIAAIAGNYVEQWIGTRITLYVDEEVTFGRKKLGGVRVRPQRATGPVTDDALDEPVDEERADMLAETFGDETEDANGSAT